MSNSDTTQKNETGEFAIRTKNQIFKDMEELIWEIFGDGSIGIPMTDSGFVNDDGFTLGSTTGGQLDYCLTGVCVDDGCGCEYDSIINLNENGTWKKLYDEYKATTNIIIITQKRCLFGAKKARCICISEPNEKYEFNSDFFKRFTGGDGISSRTHYEKKTTTWYPGPSYNVSNFFIKFNCDTQGKLKPKIGHNSQKNAK